MSIHEIARLIVNELLNGHDSIEHVCRHMNELVYSTAAK